MARGMGMMSARDLLDVLATRKPGSRLLLWTRHGLVDVFREDGRLAVEAGNAEAQATAWTLLDQARQLRLPLEAA